MNIFQRKCGLVVLEEVHQRHASQLRPVALHEDVLFGLLAEAERHVVNLAVGVEHECHLLHESASVGFEREVHGQTAANHLVAVANVGVFRRAVEACCAVVDKLFEGVPTGWGEQALHRSIVAGADGFGDFVHNLVVIAHVVHSLQARGLERRRVAQRRG